MLMKDLWRMESILVQYLWNYVQNSTEETKELLLLGKSQGREEERQKIPQKAV